MPWVEVRGVPDWVDPERLLDDGPWELVEGAWSGKRSAAEAADLQARLRNQGLGGQPIQVVVRPRLKRTVVRKARADEARRVRQTTPGFEDPRARVDEAGRIFLTPERLALQIARDNPAEHVLDACCGCGGNAIAFARNGARVTAIELDEHRLQLARHNARIYGVAERITFVRGDARDHIGKAADLVFLDPPWGQVDRIHCSDIPLLDELITRARAPVLAKLPPSFWRPGIQLQPVFGLEAGDRRRIKLVLWRPRAQR